MNLQRAIFATTLLVLLSGSAAARDWPEPGGDGLNRNATAGFRAPQTAPVERWRVTYDELLSEPVVSGGVVYVTIRRKGTRRLVALDAATGQQLASIKIAAPTFAHVSVRRARVVVVTSSSLTAFIHRGDEFKKGHTVAGSFRSPAALLSGVAVVAASDGVKVFDLRSATTLADVPSLPTKPIVIAGVKGNAVVLCQSPPTRDKHTGITRIALSGLGGEAPVAVVEGTSDQQEPFASTSQASQLLHIDGLDGPRLLIASDRPVRTTGRGLTRYFLSPSAAEMIAVQSDACIWDGTIYGRNQMGVLVAQPPREVHKVLIPKKDRPIGAVDGPITCADGVLLLGNYAFDLKAGAVLWVAPRLDVHGPLVPAGDGLVLFHDGEGSLVAAGKAVEGAERPGPGIAAGPDVAPTSGSEEAASVSAGPVSPVPVATGPEPEGATVANVAPPDAQPTVTTRDSGSNLATRPTTRPKTRPKTQPKTQPKIQPTTQPKIQPTTQPKIQPGAAPAPAARRVAPLAGSVEGVVLVDGQRLAGRVKRLKGGRVRLERKGSKPVEFSSSVLCAVETSNGLRVVGPPHGLVVATQTALERALSTELAEVVEQYARRGFPTEARRLLREIRGRDLDAARLAVVDDLVTNSEESRLDNRELLLSAATRKEGKARSAALTRMLTSVEHLADAQLTLEASALLSYASEIWPGAFAPESASNRIAAAAQPLVPAGFPWKDGQRAGERWLAWARELAPSRARFASEEETPDLGPADSIWRRDTVVLRSRNLLLVSRSRDPLTVGRCIRRGEATVRALAKVLGEAPRRDDRPLEVRLHKSRGDYIAEPFEGTTEADSNSLGFYAHALGSSRFHVPATAWADGAARGLDDVMASILTHQYLAQRWHALEENGLPGATTRGHWVIAGLARFVEDQGNKMGDLRIRLDSSDVPSLEAATVLANKGELLELATFFDERLEDVLALSRVPIVTVELGVPPVPVAYSTRSIFDDQAAALVFFLLHHAGKDGRRLFRQVLLDHCRTETESAVWKELGFETSGVLDQAFRAFLTGLSDPD